MRLHELFKADIFPDSMLSGSNDYPFDIKVEGDANGASVYIATDPETEEMVAKWKVEDAIITDRAVSEKYNYRKVFDAMCRFICKMADDSNITLMIDSKSFEKPSLKRQFVAFGFVPNSDIAAPSLRSFMERRPGSGLALVTPR